MKSEAIGALQRPIVAIPFVQPRPMKIAPVEAVEERRAASHRDTERRVKADRGTEDEAAQRQQDRALKALALQQQARQGTEVLTRPEAQEAVASPSSAPTPERTREPRTHGFEGADVGSLSHEEFFALTQSLKQTALTYRAEQPPLQEE